MCNNTQSQVQPYEPPLHKDVWKSAAIKLMRTGGATRTVMVCQTTCSDNDGTQLQYTTNKGPLKALTPPLAIQSLAYLCALMAAIVSTVLPAADVALASWWGLSAAPTDALSSPVTLGPRCTGSCWYTPEPACDNSGMLLLSDGAVLLLIDTNDASDLPTQHTGSRQ
jgi:hypothetical protein